MTKQRNDQTDSKSPVVYQIKIKGHLDCHWATWFENLTITPADNGETILAGPVIDQAALHGLLRKVRDLGLPLIAVSQVQPDQTNHIQ